MTFADFGMNEKLVEALEWMGFVEPTEIQEKAIPLAMQGRDMIGCAQTGTGKTAAFLLPIVDNLMKNQRDGIRCLIIAPTRELALQIDQQLDGLGYFTDVSSIPVYGGSDSKQWSSQKIALREGVNIMIGTPGRLLSHMNLGYMDMSQLEYLILDEADRMLDMGFIDDIKRITAQLPQKRQTLMFSATMDKKIREFAKQMLNDPAEIDVAIAKPAEGIDQRIYLSYDDKKIALLRHIVETEEVTNMIVFASRKTTVDQIYNTIKGKIDSMSMHSGREQNEREEIMRNFKSGNIKVLVATDILSRGIDVEGLSHVVNFDMPEEAADYVHRIGRTARGSATSGSAISFIGPDDMYKLIKVEKLIERKLDKLNTPEEIGPSPKWDDNARKPRKGGRGGGGGRHRGGNRNFKGKGGGGNNNGQGGGGGNRHKKGGKPHWKKKKGGGNGQGGGQAPQGGN